MLKKKIIYAVIYFINIILSKIVTKSYRVVDAVKMQYFGMFSAICFKTLQLFSTLMKEI